MNSAPLKITAIRAQVKDKSRVSVYVDGSYAFSLNIAQVVDLEIKVGRELSPEDLENLKTESDFGKIYTKSLEYAILRPRSEREMRDYFRRKPTIPRPLADRVISKLIEKKYVDDAKMARFWVENRNLKKGTSSRRLRSELLKKGIRSAIIDQVLSSSDRSDLLEIQKIITKKRRRYPDPNKLIIYLTRQGFPYSLAASAVAESHDPENSAETAPFYSSN